MMAVVGAAGAARAPRAASPPRVAVVFTRAARFAFADQHERQVRERRQVAARSDRAA